jgi:hypothetical protein
LFLLASLSSAARADLIISIESVSVPAGGSAVFDVWLTSNASATSPDLINNFGYQLQITNNGLDNTQLAFSTAQNFNYLTDANFTPSYIFLGNSSDAQPPNFAGIPITTLYPDDTFIGFDSTENSQPVSLSSGDAYLLASLTVTTSTTAQPLIGDNFTVSLVPGTGDGSVFDGTSTYFDNFDFDSGEEVSASRFSSEAGTVTIVPEPSSIAASLVGIVIVGGIQWARRSAREFLHFRLLSRLASFFGV